MEYLPYFALPDLPSDDEEEIGDQVFEARGEAQTFKHTVHLKQLIDQQVVPPNVRCRSRYVETGLIRQTIDFLTPSHIEYCLSL